mmetsp:Transcript_16701/g.40712  ORF Transcript_16701/g.40712 Transcript_16701/m.40712 type:complete len:243 (+) Transcript_16701:837-1565(+)
MRTPGMPRLGERTLPGDAGAASISLKRTPGMPRVLGARTFMPRVTPEGETTELAGATPRLGAFFSLVSSSSLSSLLKVGASRPKSNPPNFVLGAKFGSDFSSSSSSDGPSKSNALNLPFFSADFGTGDTSAFGFSSSLGTVFSSILLELPFLANGILLSFFFFGGLLALCVYRLLLSSIRSSLFCSFNKSTSCSSSLIFVSFSTSCSHVSVAFSFGSRDSSSEFSACIALRASTSWSNMSPG